MDASRISFQKFQSPFSANIADRNRFLFFFPLLKLIVISKGGQKAFAYLLHRERLHFMFNFAAKIHASTSTDTFQIYNF